MELTSKVDGFTECLAFLDQFPQRVQNNILQAATDQAGTVMKQAIKAAAPSHGTEKQSPSSTKYGTLKSNIRKLKLKQVPPATKMTRVDTGNAFWGLIIEIGSRYMPAKPWFSPAFDNAAPAAIDKMRDVCATKIESEALKLAGETGSNKKR